MDKSFPIPDIRLTPDQVTLFDMGFRFSTPHDSWSFQPCWMHRDLATGKVRLVSPDQVPIEAKQALEVTVPIQYNLGDRYVIGVDPYMTDIRPASFCVVKRTEKNEVESIVAIYSSRDEKEFERKLADTIRQYGVPNKNIITG